MSDTPDTTRLTDEQVQESLSWLSRAQQAERHTVAVALWANTYGHQLHAHITTLAAELARVEGERDRLRESLRMTDSALAEARDVLESEGYTGIVRLIDNATHERDEMERAAPSAADRDHAGESGEVGL